MKPAFERTTTRLRAAYRLAMLCMVFATAWSALAQNSMVGDGFGGRLWYRPTNYTVGSYSAFSLCYSDPCDTTSNQLYGWGNDNNGELGNGPDTLCSDVPVAIPGMTNVRYFSAGYMVGAIKNDGTGWVWSHSTFPSPTQVLAGARFVDVSASYASFVKDDGTVWSIGANGGQFGDGTTISSNTAPVQMPGVTNAVRVACGMATNYVLLADSTVLSVGGNTSGLLGDPAIMASYTTVVGPVSNLSRIVDIQAHTFAAAALDANGDVYCWGDGAYDGDGDLDTNSVPERIASLSNIVAISSSTDGRHFLALDAEGNCYAWGFWNYGAAFDHVPRLVATDVIDIMAGETFSYIVKTDGTLWAAGWSRTCSIWLDLPNLDGTGQPTYRHVFVQLDPAVVPSACPVVATTAIPDLPCSSSTGTITVSHFGGQAPYQYDIGNGPQSSPMFTGLPAGDYTITVTDATGCTTVVVATLSAGPPPMASIIVTDTVIALGGFAFLFASGGDSYAWYPSTGLSCATCPNPVATPTETTDYCVIASDSCASDTACVRIIVERSSACSSSSIFIPTAFSPDGSGANDQQCVYGADCIANMLLQVFDRWGNKVFESTDPKDCWDGIYKGQALDPAVFVYHLSATMMNGETVERQGNITLVR